LQLSQTQKEKLKLICPYVKSNLYVKVLSMNIFISIYKPDKIRKKIKFLGKINLVYTL